MNTQKLRELAQIINAQAEDEGLWFIAKTAPEAYLQQELRKLHSAVEAACPANILALIDSHAELLRKAKQYAENWLLDERDDHDREICICDEHYRHIQELFAAITKAEAL